MAALATIHGLINFFKDRFIPELSLVDGTIGSPHLIGYSESRERWYVAIVIAAAGLIAAATQVLFRKWRRWPPNLQQQLANAGLALGIFFCAVQPTAWVTRAAVLAAFFLVPWGRVFPKRIPTIPPRIGIALVGGVSFALAFTQLQSPWEPVGIKPLGAAYQLGIFIASSFAAYALGPKAYRYCLLLPILPCARLITFVTRISFWDLADARYAANLSLIPAGVFVIVMAQLCFFRRLRPVWQYLTVPFFLYFGLYALNLNGEFQFHEGDIFQASLALLEGKHPYRDIFIPHGVGLASIGTAGMKLAGPTLAAFRIGYSLLAPVAWIFLYLTFVTLFRRRKYVVPLAALSTLLAWNISSYNFSTFAIPFITWHGGIKFIAPALTMFLLSRYFVARRPSWAIAVGAASALALFVNVENGIAAIAASTTGFVASGRYRPARSLLHGVIALVSLIAASVIFWSPFGTFAELASGLKYHLLTFVPRHSQLLGQPFFFLADNLVDADRFILYVPMVILAVAIAGAIARRNPSPAQVFLIPASVLSFFLFQVVVGRTDFWHILTVAPAFGFLLFTTLGQITRPRDLAMLAILGGLAGGPVGIEPKIMKDAFRKTEESFFAVTRNAFNPRVEGPHPTLDDNSYRLLSETRKFFDRQPELEKKAFFLTESGYLFKTLLGVFDPTPWTLHHYLVGIEEQRTAIRLIEDNDVKLVFEGPSIRFFDNYPAYVRWPLVSDYLTRNFSPCTTLGQTMTTILIRNDEKFRCVNETRDPAQLSHIYPSPFSLGYIPYTLSENIGAEWFTGQKFLAIRLQKKSSGKKFLVVNWNCDGKFVAPGKKQIFFAIDPSRVDYAVPLSANPLWGYCGSPDEKAVWITDAQGRDYDNLAAVNLIAGGNLSQRVL